MRVEDILGPGPNRETPHPEVETLQVEPPPFPFEGFTEGLSPEDKNELALALWPVVRPFLATGYTAAAALNKGLAVFSEHMDSVAELFESGGFGKSEGIFELAAKGFDSNTAYWKDRAEKVGVSFLDELLGEAVGGAAPGIGEFLLNVPWAATVGMAEEPENPVAGALTEGAKRGALGGIFRAIGPLKQYLRSPIFGGTFAVQAAAEGAPPQEIAKSFGTGAIYSLSSPGGTMGLNEISRNLRRQIPRVEAPIPEKGTVRSEPDVKEISKGKERIEHPTLREEFADRVREEPEIRDRKYWKTVEEAERTMEEPKRIMREIQAEEPQINIVMPNRESLEKAYSVMDKKGFAETVDYVHKADLKPVEKGALYNVLMERAQKVGDFNKFVEIMDNYSLYLVDLGRGVQIASVWNRSTPAGFVKWAEKQLASVNAKRNWVDTLFGMKKAALTKADKEYIVREFIETQKMPESVDKSNRHLELVDFIALKVPPGVSEKIDAFRYQNMLSGPQTQMRNIGWNMSNTFVFRPGELGIEGIIDYAAAGLRGRERQVYVKDVPGYYKTLLNSVPTASQAFMSSWRMKPGEVMGKPDLGLRYKTPFEAARAKQLPKAITIVQRFMEASDRFNAVLISSAEYAKLKKRGWSDLEAQQRSQEIAKRVLLRDELDPGSPGLSYPAKLLEGMGKGIEQMRRIPAIGKPLGWFVPFIRTPIKLGTQMIERSPLGWARSKMDTEAMSRLMGGAIVTSMGAVWAHTGDVTWAPPSNPILKAWFYASGRKPFSFKYKDKWYPLWYLGPYALAFAFPAAVKYYHSETNKSLTSGETEQIAEIAEGIARFIGSQTSAQSIGNFFAWASGDVDYQVRNQLGFTFGQVIPGNGMVRYINKALDPIYRKPEGFWEQVAKDLPAFSKALPPRYTPFMEEAKREWFNMLVPYDIGVEREEYSAFYNWTKIQQRQEYLQGKISELANKMEKGEFRDKHIDEFQKIFEAMPKTYRGIQ